MISAHDAEVKIALATTNTHLAEVTAQLATFQPGSQPDFETETDWASVINQVRDEQAALGALRDLLQGLLERTQAAAAASPRRESHVIIFGKVGKGTQMYMNSGSVTFN